MSSTSKGAATKASHGATQPNSSEGAHGYSFEVPATTATLQPSFAEVQPPRGTQQKGKKKDIKSSKAASDLTHPRTQSRAAQESKHTTPPGCNTLSKRLLAASRAGFNKWRTKYNKR